MSRFRRVLLAGLAGLAAFAAWYLSYLLVVLFSSGVPAEGFQQLEFFVFGMAAGIPVAWLTAWGALRLLKVRPAWPVALLAVPLSAVFGGCFVFVPMTAGDWSAGGWAFVFFALAIVASYMLAAYLIPEQRA
ncbi:hypothetical protein [Longispora albida]|uniref:hypothetical protein n=1 Tax=Longispora albida TaxID=203523 RepID=UPI00035CA2E0|nr:hypothetical protein [Longispora albida]